MLEPRDRQLLFEALRPPVGYEFDQGIGTTFTLDLLALLIAPVAFTVFERIEDGGPAPNSLGWLESLRRHADRLTMFCHAGYTAVPRARYPQLAFIEESVIECLPANGALFHPKVWVLRYVGSGPVKYRVLNLSRNLVFARSWDTMLTLDGEVSPNARAQRANDGLVEFVRALPAFASRISSKAVSERLELLAAELQTARFELPEGVESLRFWPLGVRAKAPDPFKQMGKRLVVVSPFVTVGALERLAAGRSECTVVSTPTQLAALVRRPAGVTAFRILNDRALAEVEAPEGADAPSVSDSLADAIQQAQLHAKLYVSEVGAEAHVWTGSANATDSGLGRNVEMLVELVGPKRLLGIDALMKAERDQLRFVNVLVDADDLVAKQPLSDEERELERAFDAARAALAGARLEARVEIREGGTFNVSVACGKDRALVIDPLVSPNIRPITMTGASHPVRSAGPAEVVAEFPALTFEALTAFFECDLTGRLGGDERHCRFVLTLPLLGAPGDRRERILRELLKDRNRVFRFLMLLLADEGVDPFAGNGQTKTDPAVGQDQPAFISAGLLEMLLRALDHAPSRLDHVESLLGQLSRDAEGRALLPEGFDAVWQPIWQHRQRAKAEPTA